MVKTVEELTYAIIVADSRFGEKSPLALAARRAVNKRFWEAARRNRGREIDPEFSKRRGRKKQRPVIKWRRGDG